MVMPRYERAGIGVSAMPNVTTIGMQEAARTSQTLAQAMDRMANFAFRQAATQAEIQGREYGALNAPTQQQLQDAISTGQDVETLVPGDDSTIFGRAAKGSALDSISTAMELDARKSIADMQAQFENGDITFDELETGLEALVSTQTDMMRQISPLAAQKFSASVGVVSNSAYLSAAKTEAKNNKADFEINVRQSMDTIVRNVETLVKAGPVVSEDGTIVTVEQRVQTLRDGLAAAAQEINDVELYQTKINELEAAYSAAKIGVVMNEAIENPVKAMSVIRGNGRFEDAEVQATFETLTDAERRELFGQARTELSNMYSLDSQQESFLDRQRADQSKKLQAEFTTLVLNGDRDKARELLPQLLEVDESAYESKLTVLETEPGYDNMDSIVTLRRLSLQNKLTQSDIDAVYSNGKMTMATYKEFMLDLENQRNQKYNAALTWLKADRGLPDRTLVNFSKVQRAADQEVANIKKDLITAIADDPSIDPMTFVKDAVAELIRTQGDAADRAKRERAEQVLQELQALTGNDDLDATGAIDYLNDANREWYTNPAKTSAALEVLPLLNQLGQ